MEAYTPREEARNGGSSLALLYFLDTYLYCHLRYPIPISFVKEEAHNSLGHVIHDGPGANNNL